jgi:AraC-like DNA-binding protein
VTYPLELRENTSLYSGAYPVNLFRNVSPSGPAGRCVLYLHWHDHFEIIHLIAGSVVFHIDTITYETHPGDVLIVPSGGLHVGYAMHDNKVEYTSLVFNRSLLADADLDMVHKRYLIPFLDGQLRFPVKLDGHLSDFDTILGILQQIEHEFEQRNFVYELVVKAKLTWLFSLLVRVFWPEREKEHADFPDKRMDRFKSLILHIQACYDKKLTIADAAGIVNLTPHHFCKVFKSATGRTFIDFVNRYRMDEAERLLRRGGMTVTEVAERVGCGNLNYFTRLYKQIKGTTPSQIKRTIDR